MSRPYGHPLPPIREHGLFVEFPSATPGEVRTQLLNCGWRYANGRWWYKGRAPHDEAVSELEGAIARYGESVDGRGGEYGEIKCS